MKVIQSSFFRIIVTAIVGILLIEYREAAVEKITIAIGILFLLSGIISIAAYIGASKHSSDTQLFDAEGRQLLGTAPAFPVVGIGSVILGIILMVMPGTFITGLMYCFAAILILGAVGQFFTLVMARKFARIGFYYWIMPILLFLVGLMCIVHPQTIASAPLFFIGWCLLVYAVVEAVNAIKIHNCKKTFYKQYDAQHPAEEEAEATEIKEEDQKEISE